MIPTAIKITRADAGRRLSLDEYEAAEFDAETLFELGRGTVVVSDVPDPKHLAQVLASKRQFFRYDDAHPGRIHTIAGGNECRLLLADLQSERHPDLAIYKDAPPKEDIWSTWIPDIVIEVVSPGSEVRDYVEKREEYLQFGVREYWIVDADKEEVLVLRRSRGKWKEEVVKESGVITTRLLPGFEFKCAKVFSAARAEE